MGSGVHERLLLSQIVTLTTVTLKCHRVSRWRAGWACHCLRRLSSSLVFFCSGALCRLLVRAGLRLRALDYSCSATRTAAHMQWNVAMVSVGRPFKGRIWQRLSYYRSVSEIYVAMLLFG